MKGLKELMKKLRGKKKTEEIPEDSIRCTHCGKIVKKENATLSLPEEQWVCDDCFFGDAE